MHPLPLFLKSIYRVLSRLCAVCVAVVLSSSAYAKTTNQTRVLDNTQMVEFSPQLSAASHRDALAVVLLELYPHFTDADIASLVEEFDHRITGSNQPFFIHHPSLDDEYEAALTGTTKSGVEWEIIIDLIIIVVK